MSSSFLDRSFDARAILVLSLPLAGIGCKGASANAAPSSEVVECPPVPAANEDGGAVVAPYEGFANGSVSGTSVNGALCNAEILLSDFNGSTSGLVLTVDSTAAFATTSVTLPAGALAGTLTGRSASERRPRASIRARIRKRAARSRSVSGRSTAEWRAAKRPLGRRARRGARRVLLC